MSASPSLYPGFSTDDLVEIFSPAATVGAMLRFEEALAVALAETGIIPDIHAEEIVEAVWAGVEDPVEILSSSWDAGTPVIALQQSVTARLSAEAARSFHYGATSQDVIDTAQMLQARSALGALDGLLARIGRRLADLTRDFRDQPQMGRTFLQDAVPMTFGFRTATWLDAVLGHIIDLRARRQGLVVQLGGPVGTLASYGDKSRQVVESLADRLGLGAPDISWHTDRSRIVSLAQSVARAAATMSKIASDVALLASTAIAEVEVRSGGSSSMAGKRNPIDSVHAVAAASVCQGAAQMMASSPPQQLDRGIGGWHIEWLALPLAFQSAAASMEATATCLESLEVDVEKMALPTGSPEIAGTTDQVDRVLGGAERLLG